jgi:plastocyanin
MVSVAIEDFVYKGPDTVAPGAKVDVVNADSTAHTLTADEPGQFDVTTEAGATAGFTAPTKPGKYPYHCTFHANMTGTLVVK